MNPLYEHLFKPIKIKHLKLKNRICMAPMHTNYATIDGEVTQKLIEYFVERAKGGVALIVVENTCVEWMYGKGDGNPTTIHDDKFRPGLAHLVQSVHKYGAKIIPELHHVGRQTFSSNIGGRMPLAPSAVKSEVGGDMPRAMTDDEILKTIEDFKQAARRAKEVGFDGVELHGAHGYLFSGFISPRTNKRTDRWGGAFENRCRFAVEVVRAVRKEVGKDFPLFFRFSAEESAEDGLSLEDGVRYAQVLEKEGIDCFDVSHGTYESIKHFPMQGDSLTQLVYLSEAVKKAVSVPVIAVGSLGIDPVVASNVIKEGKADMVHFGRELLAEPHLVNHIKMESLSQARQCIRCNECTGSINKGHPLACAVNPVCGLEYKNPKVKKPLDKRIVVMGAGPAGLEYAITAAKLGCRVTLLEKKDRIGGLASVCACTAYKKNEISRMLGYYKTMIDVTGVDLRLGIDATAEVIAKLQPDHVALAMGAVPLELNIKGAEYAHIGIYKQTDNAEGLGQEVCIIGGSGVGIDIALFLAERGIRSTILEMTDDIAGELNAMLTWHLLDYVKEKDIQILTSHKAIEIAPEGVLAEIDGKKVRICCDDVLIAIGFKRVDASRMQQALNQYNIDTQIIGNMAGAGHFMDAIGAGYWDALDLIN